MLRLRPYKSCDSKHIADWIKNEETFVKWGGERFGSYPINAKIIDDKYRLNNGDCVEEDNFYPMTAFDDSGVVGHFIMRYINGNNKILRFGWVIVDDTQRGKGYGKQMLELGLKYAFEISEKFDTPVILRLTTRVAHSRSLVELCERQVP